MAFDLLALGDDDLTGRPFSERRAALEGILGGAHGPSRVHLTPVTDDPTVAEDWFTRFEGAGFDGVMAKPADQPYQQDKRVMFKVKHERTADCVVAGFRWHKDGEGVGLAAPRPVRRRGHAAPRRRGQQLHRRPAQGARRRARPAAERRAPRTTRGASGAEAEAHDEGRKPGGQSRWNVGKDLIWEPLRTELVAEVRYEHVLAGRFRHGGRLARFRPDRTPESCTYGQLEQVAPAELAAIFPEA